MASPSICIQPCDMTAYITWTNYGEAGIFTPAVLVDDIRTELLSEKLGSNSSVTHSFSITGLLLSYHTICPDPN